MYYTNNSLLSSCEGADKYWFWRTLARPPPREQFVSFVYDENLFLLHYGCLNPFSGQFYLISDRDQPLAALFSTPFPQWDIRPPRAICLRKADCKCHFPLCEKWSRLCNTLSTVAAISNKQKVTTTWDLYTIMWHWWNDTMSQSDAKSSRW